MPVTSVVEPARAIGARAGVSRSGATLAGRTGAHAMTVRDMIGEQS